MTEILESKSLMYTILEIVEMHILLEENRILILLYVASQQLADQNVEMMM